jgi:hypothetical protein
VFREETVRQDAPISCPDPACGMSAIVDSAEHVPILMIGRTVNGLRIASGADLMNETSSMSIWKLEHVDWLWRSIEAISGVRLRHREWERALCARFDDVIGDAPFDFLKPMGDMAGKSLLAIDTEPLQETKFRNEMLPQCGEVCVHARSHFKYTPRSETRLAYMKWECGEFDSISRERRLDELRIFLHSIPRKKRASVLSPHGFQVGATMLDGLKSLGVEHILVPFAPGEAFTAGEHSCWDTRPFDSPNFHVTRLPNGVNTFFHSWIRRDMKRWGMASPFFLKEEESSSIDLLYGLRLFEPPDKFLRPLDGIMERVRQVRGIAAVVGFPVILFTHETAVGYLGDSGWRDLWRLIWNELSEYKAMRLSDVLSAMEDSAALDCASQSDVCCEMKA